MGKYVIGAGSKQAYRHAEMMRLWREVESKKGQGGKWQHAYEYGKTYWGRGGLPWSVGAGEYAQRVLSSYAAEEARINKERKERKELIENVSVQAELKIISEKKQKIEELKLKQQQAQLAQKEALQLQKEWEKKEKERAYYDARQAAFSDVTKPKRAFLPCARSPRAMASRVQQTRQRQAAPRQFRQTPSRRISTRGTGVVRQPTIPRRDVNMTRSGRSSSFTRPNVSRFSVNSMRRKGGSNRAF